MIRVHLLRLFLVDLVTDQHSPLILMNKVTVLHLIESLAFGGAEVTLSLLVTHLRRGAYDPVVCCLTGGPLKSEIERNGVPVITLNITRRSILLLPLFLLDITRAMIKLFLIVRRRNVDIIHAHLVDCVILGRDCRKTVRHASRSKLSRT